MSDSLPEGPVMDWLQEALLLIAGDTDHCFKSAQEAVRNGTPEQGIELLYELDDRLCTLLGQVPRVPICELHVPILRRILVRCDMLIANTWVLLVQRNPGNRDFQQHGLEAAKEQIVFLRSLPNYDVMSDEELPADLRKVYAQFLDMFGI